MVLLLLGCFCGCDEQRNNVQDHPKDGKHATHQLGKEAQRSEEGYPKNPSSTDLSSSSYQRFVLPSRSQPFPDASVALDTKTGQLCKTYPWQDMPHLPQGLPVCASASTSAQNSTHIDFTPIDRTAADTTAFIGSRKDYLGYTYTFDGKSWHKGEKAQRYVESTGKIEPASDDQFDPLGLLTKTEKSKRLLTQEQIIRVAEKFGVSYEAVWADAKAQGYQVPAPYSRDNPFVPH